MEQENSLLPGGLVLFAAVSALLLCNFGFNATYDQWVTYPVMVPGTDYGVKLVKIINDGLMAIFFLVVTLEIRYEFTAGSLRETKQVLMPIIAAVGGMVVPGLVYWVFNWKSASLVGWAVPTATDIAFSLACLMLVAKRVPPSLRVFLLTLAVIDDLSAILIIALFYTDYLVVSMLLGCLGMAFVMFGVNKLGYRSGWIYGLLGLIFWVFMLKSGIHATLAGCGVAMLLPTDQDGKQLVVYYQRFLPWVQYLILPLFAFLNTGVVLSSDVYFGHPVFLGIVLGLFVGKPLGVVLFSFAAEQLKIAQRAMGVTYRHILGVGFLCGIGFTMSLFVAMLAFDGELLLLMDTARAAILMGSLLAGLFGIMALSQKRSKI